MRIGELAALAGVSTRAVRHYHQVGLLPEPVRRANGYRDYGLRDAVALARVRRLTELGLGLEEVRDVLADDAGRELRDVLIELDADLARQEEAIRTRRTRLAALLRRAEEHGGLPDEGPVSEQLAELFAEMARASAAMPGPEPVMAAKDREVLALLETAAGSDDQQELMSALRETFTAPGGMERAYEVYGLFDGLAEAEPGDPEVADVARALADCLPQRVVARSVLDSGWPVGSGTGAGSDGGTAGGAGDGAGFAEAVFADLAPAQAEAVRRAIRLVVERERSAEREQDAGREGER